MLALHFELLPENLRVAVIQRLAQDVEKRGHLTTGFLGVSHLCPVLSRVNRSDLAWQLLLTDSYPSWLFPVKNGATTIWERWDGWTPERGFQNPAMNSFNHYSLGAVGSWFYSGAAGIQLDESHPGYKQFFLRPQITSRLTYFKASFDSPYGLIASDWRVEKDQIFYDVTIPPNTSARLMLPVPPRNGLSSGKPLSAEEADFTDILLPAGNYRLSFRSHLVK